MNEEWAKAFVAAQGDLPDITKDKTVTVKTKTGQSFKYSYADLPTIVAKIRPVLAKNGLAVAQDVEIQDGRVVVTTRIYHTSGHMETFGPVVLNGGNDAQAAGSAITYARRYALCAALNIAADEDDDGQINKNSAGSAASQRPAEPKASASPPNHSRGGDTPQAAQPSSPQASPTDVPPSRDQSQAQEVASHNKENEPEGAPVGNSVPPGSESWVAIKQAVESGALKQTSVHIHAATLCTGRDGVSVPSRFEDVKDCPDDILAAVADHFKVGVAA
jgi:hypothetical protein